MKIKTLAIAAATLAVGAITSQAQVYSQNIVGYVNVHLYGQGKYSLVANPLDDGNGNQLTNLFASLPAGSKVLTWNGTGYNTYVNVGGNWNGGANNTTLTPGMGFFVVNGKVTGGTYPDITNTFTGSIIVPSQGAATNSIPLLYSLQGSPSPLAGSLAVTNTSAGDTNFVCGANLSAGSRYLTWNPITQGYNTYIKVGGTWNGTASVNVGDGFFIYNKNGPVTNWVQSAPY
jgi:hypothetical protein